MKENVIYNVSAEYGLQRIPDNSVDLCVTSPPYDDLRTYDGYSFDFKLIANELYRVLKPGGVLVWVVGDATVDGSETFTSLRQALYFRDVVGFNAHDTMIYLKDGFTNVGSLNVRYAGCFEYMFVFSKGKVKSFNPLKDRLNSTFGNKICGSIRQVDGSMKSKSNLGKRTKRYGIRYNVWKYSVGFKKSGDDFSFEHPASFPENLAGDHIKSWSNEGGLVLDPFMGSGTTAKMAYLLNRKFLGFEISKKYCDLIQKRLNPHINNLFSNLGNVIKYEFESKD